MSITTKSDLTIGGNVVFSGDVTKAPGDIAKKISASGSASILIPTTIATLQFKTTYESDRYSQVQVVLNARASAVVGFLSESNVAIDKLSTNSYSVYPRYTYNPYKFDKYVGTYGIIFKAPIEDAGSIIDDIVDLGQDFTLQWISYTAEEDAKSIAKKEAIAQATNNAIISAESALRDTAYKLGEIYDISVQNGYTTTSYETAPKMEAIADMSEPAPVIGNEENITANVTLKALYEIKA